MTVVWLNHRKYTQAYFSVSFTIFMKHIHLSLHGKSWTAAASMHFFAGDKQLAINYLNT